MERRASQVTKWNLERFYKLKKGNLKLLIVSQDPTVIDTLEVLFNLCKVDVISTYKEECNLGIVLSEYSFEFEQYYKKVLLEINFGKIHVEIWSYGKSLVIRR